MPYEYQILNVEIDPVGSKPQKILIRRVVVCPNAFHMPKIVWPKVKSMKSPIRVHLFIPGANNPLDAKGRPFTERSRHGVEHGMFLEMSRHAKASLRTSWKVAEGKKERRLLPRITDLEDPGLPPLVGTLLLDTGEGVEAQVLNYTINGLGLRLPDRVGEQIAIHQRIMVTLFQESSKDVWPVVPGEGTGTGSGGSKDGAKGGAKQRAHLQLLPGDSKNSKGDELESISFFCVVRRIVQYQFAPSEAHPFVDVGFTIDRADRETDRRWRSWLRAILERLKEKFVDSPAP